MRKNGTPPDGRPVLASKGQCSSCLKRDREGGSVKVLTVFDKEGIVCNNCKEHLPFKNFSPSKGSLSGRHGVCRTCQRLRKYSLTKDTYRQLLSSQGGTCAICKAPPKSEFSLVTDHDHSCCLSNRKSCGSCNRGLLCPQCNVILGMAHDSPDTLLKAAEYLINVTRKKEIIG